MRINGNVAVTQRIYFGALKAACAPGFEQMKLTPPDEAQEGYSMAAKKGRRFIHCHQVSVLSEP
jgi:hypothetical protein